MADVSPFRGIRYDPQRVGGLDDVITPPWDVIDPEVREGLLARSPHNICHLILPKDRADLDRYEAAGHDLEAWLVSGVLRQDAQESYYLVEQTFTGLDGREYTRRGFFGIAKIPEAGERVVLGHERTFDHKVADRLCLMEATRAQFGAIFVLYEDPRHELAAFFEPMDSRAEDVHVRTVDGVMQRIWCVGADARVGAFFHDKLLYIADGHHRFRTATLYRDAMREREQPDGLRPYDFVLMGFVPFDDPGLFIHAPHRVADMPEGFSPEAMMKQLAPWFDVTPATGDLLAAVNAHPGCAIGVAVHGGGQYLLVLKDGADRVELLGHDHGPAWRDLDMAVLHRGILERGLGLPEGMELRYEPDAERALASVASGEKGLVFLLKPTRPEQVAACADAGEFMPQKATYFFPKLPTGGVFHRLV